jgi:cysteine desulfurase/selenocysteine lyase
MHRSSDFGDFGSVTYLNAAAQGPLPKVSVDAAKCAIAWKEHPYQLKTELYLGLPDRVRSLIARLVGGSVEEVAITTGATSGLIAVAHGLNFRSGDEVLIAEDEFPGHFSAFLPLQETHGISVKEIKARDRYLNTRDFIREIGPRTRLVSTSLVRYDDGAQIDAQLLADSCHRAGAYLALDVSQCLGVLPVDARVLRADFLVGVGYKWLLSPFGTGLFWIRHELIDQMRPAPCYWTGIVGAEQFFLHGDRIPYLSNGIVNFSPNAKRWDSPETASFTNLAAMETSLTYLLGLNILNLRKHNQELISIVHEHFPRDRFALASSPRAGAPFLCIAARSALETSQWHKRLTDERVFVSLRAGALRISPHIYNTVGDIDRLLAVLCS